MNLQIALKGEYFDAIKKGNKYYEFREFNNFWQKRLVGKNFDKIILTKGYPSKTETEKFLTFDYAGYIVKKLTHKHFGDQPLTVFAIRIVDNLKNIEHDILSSTLLYKVYEETCHSNTLHIHPIESKIVTKHKEVSYEKAREIVYKLEHNIEDLCEHSYSQVFWYNNEGIVIRHILY